MPSARAARLQDEAAVLISEQEELRSKDTLSSEDVDRLSSIAKRLEEVTVELRREREMDEKVAALAAARAPVASDSDSMVAVRKAPAVRSRGGKVPDGYETFEAAASAGMFLRGIATGEVRAPMGETAPTYNTKGAELTYPTEVYDAVINQLTRQCVALRVAGVYNTVAKKLTLPKAAEGTAVFYDEAATITPADIATSGVEVTLYGLRRATSISNDLFEDSVVDVAKLFTDNTANAFATAIDKAWLQGDPKAVAKGLVGEVTNDVGVTDAKSTTLADLAEMVGLIDPLAQNTAWVVSPAGWSALLAAHSQSMAAVLADAVAPMAFGRPVYVTNGLPTGTLALYGDFTMATAVAIRSSGLRIEALRELQALSDCTVMVAKQRVGIANHAPEFVAKLTVGGP